MEPEPKGLVRQDEKQKLYSPSKVDLRIHGKSQTGETETEYRNDKQTISGGKPLVRKYSAKPSSSYECNKIKAKTRMLSRYNTFLRSPI